MKIAKLSLFLLVMLSVIVQAQAQSTAFTYQGNLRDSGNPANGNYDFQIALFDAISGGTQVGTTLTLTNIAVSNGSFSMTLDFGACSACFNGATRFLEVAVKLTSGGAFTTLSPRQPIASSPYATRSQNAGTATTADGLSVACVSCVTSSQIQGVDGSQVTGSIAGSQISGSIPVGSVPTGSGNYIQNTATALRQGKTSLQQAAGFNIDGDGIAAGTLSGNIVNATTQYNLGGLRMLSNVGQFNLFAGEGAGDVNSGGSNSFFGYHAGMGNTTGVRNNFFGSVTGEANTTGADNNFFGDSAGRFNTSGSNNSFFGSNAGLNNGTASDNSFFGFNSGRNNTTGFGNAFFGYRVGDSNTRGNQNSFLGELAGFSNTTGSSNSFFGAQAGFTNGSGSDNVYFGWHTGFNALGNQNTFIGSDAGFANSTGDNNTFVGSGAGSLNSSGSSNTMIGANTDVSGLVTFATAIGSGARVSQSNSIVLGRQINQTSADSVGIGIPNPARTLDVSGRARIRSIPLEASTAAVCFNSAGDLLQCGASSLRWKRNIQPFRSGLEVIRRLRPISYTWKEDGREDFGLGAEEVAKVAPNLVFTNKAGEVEGVKYEKLNLLLINAVKEQQTQISQLQRQLSDQSNQLKQQQNQIEMMKKLLCLDHPLAAFCQ